MNVKMENIDTELVLIQAIEQFPLIYDETLREYKDNKKKQS